MANLIEIIAEGTQDNYTALGQTLLFESDNLEEVMFEYRLELESYRNSGAEVVESGKDRAFIIDSYGRVAKIIDVQ